MNLPGVSSVGVPPLASMEYRCGQPSRSARNTSFEPPSAQCRLDAPAVCGYEPTNVSGLCHTTCACPVRASATRIDHGCGVCCRIGCGGPPLPGWRVNAMRVPSGDQRGSPSTLVEGATYRIDDWSSANTPMKA